MGTWSEDIQARYAQVERETDTFGREITVRRLRPSEDFAIRRLIASDTGNVNLQMMVAAAVRSIDGKPFPLPKTQADVDVLLDTLDGEGLEAAVKAYARLMGLAKSDDGAAVETVEEKAKKSSTTSASAMLSS